MPRDKTKRERLVNAAAELFWIDGYAATSLADIAKSADVPLGNVYYYFKTKRAISAAVGALFVTQTKSALAEIDASNKAPAERIFAFLDLIASSNAARAKHGCPIAQAIREARLQHEGAGEPADAPALAPTEGAGQVLWMMVDWIAEQARAAGISDAQNRADRAIAEWQGAIVLAQARGEVAVLDQAIERIRRQFAAGY